jgi:uncharacterized membrane protein
MSHQRPITNVSHSRWFRRLMLAILIAGVTYLVFPVPTTIRVLLAYDLGMLFLVGDLGWTMWNSSPERTHRHAQDEEPSGIVLLSTVVIFTLISLVAISLLLDNTKGLSSFFVNFHMALSLLAIFLSWFMVHMYYAIHYARIYYDTLPDVIGSEYQKGLEFPTEDLICYRDFLYYSFTIAMCYQTSDVTIVSQEIRSLSLIQSILSFIFVALIFGLVVNVVSNLV